MDAQKLLTAFTLEECREFASALPADIIEAEVRRRGHKLPLAAGTMAFVNFSFIFQHRP